MNRKDIRNIRHKHKEKVCESCRNDNDEVVNKASGYCDRNEVGCERRAKYIVVSSDYKPDYPDIF